ncbi:lysozyme [Hwanghaeella grinnelliae]|uniref:Lysozyme n=2 Tax=Hwanghaeella grinnelliae TaxID=2500179 RepID=A0A3S2Y6L9_9PROT|nr:lysozyme [Hwanghaeella grinnelliae]
MKLSPYTDTVGKVTIGVGRNLDDVGISETEALVMLDADIDRAMEDLRRNVPSVFDRPEPVQRALVTLCFNMGWPRLSGFRRMGAHLELNEYGPAADEALNNKWARQVGNRARRLAGLIREG